MAGSDFISTKPTPLIPSEVEGPAHLLARPSTSLGMSGASNFGIRLRTCKRGATALEFALIAPPLLMLLIGTMDVGRLLWTRAALHDAVARAARCAAVTPDICGNPDEIGAFARTSATKSALGDAQFTLQHGFCGVQVRARLGYHALVPFFGWLAPELEATACVP